MADATGRTMRFRALFLFVLSAALQFLPVPKAIAWPFFVGAVSLFIVTFLPSNWLHRRLFGSRGPALGSDPATQSSGYLAARTTELSEAVRLMAFQSAWGKWYSAQQLAADGSVDDEVLIHTACSLAGDAAANGVIEVRGRAPGEVGYTAIPRAIWAL